MSVASIPKSGSVVVGKSTTDRLLPIPFPAWLRRAFRWLTWWSEDRAARLAMRWFFTPRAARLSENEAAVLEQSNGFTLATPRGPVRGYAWGRGPAVFLVHGWGGHAGQMTHLVPPLLARGFRAVALDMPAHGASQGPANGKLSSLLHFAAALEAAGQVFGPAQAIVAHSFGAASATYAMARGLAVERAVFFAPPVWFESFWRRFGDGLGIEPGVWHRMVQRSEEWLGARFADLEPRALASRQTKPLLVLHDRKDSQVLFEEGTALAAAWPGAELVETRGLGHLRILRDRVCLERAAEFAASGSA